MFLPCVANVLQDGGKQLQEGMEDNFNITTMDLRFTECGQESEYCISQIIERNQEKKREGEKYKWQRQNFYLCDILLTFT